MNSQVGRAKKRYRRSFGIAAAMVAVALYAAIVLATGTTSDVVLGQLGFTHNVPNLVDGKGLNRPQAVAIDSSATPNRVYVADQDNNRVLGWRDADSFSNGAAADLVIGQPDFLSSKCNGSNAAVSANSLCDPAGVAVDGAGNLYVADDYNNRVLEYTNPFVACNNTFPCVGGAANLVFGQGASFRSDLCNFDTVDSSSTAIDLCNPAGVVVDALGNLYVADGGNNRVLEYNTPLTTDVTADKVFGQGGSFTSNNCDFDTDASTSTAIDLCGPSGDAVDASGNLYVADGGNNRVLEYNTPLTTNVTADTVFGQGGSFTSNNCDFDTVDGSSTAIDLCGPSGVAVDASENLYVADQSNGRVLEYNTPLTTDVTADMVFGQGGDFTSDAECNYDSGSSGSESTANDLCDPAGVAVDALGNLYVADQSNNRVAEYNTPLSSGTIAERVLGQDDLLHNVANLVDAAGLNFPEAVAIDASAIPNRLYVADEENNRVLGWRDAGAFINGAAADLVIGQPDFLSSMCNGISATVSANSLCYPEGVAVDALGNLYVADENNNRVLEYANPFSACNNIFPCVGGGANVVLGQGTSFTSNSCDYDTGDGNVFSGASAIDQCYPKGVAVDGGGNLYVADASNSRVLEYNAPLSTGAGAARVFGQGGSFTTNACNFDGGAGVPALRPSSAIDLCDPSGVGLDGGGNLYVADQDNNRVLEYNTPLTTDVTADTVFGQGGSFTSHACNYDGTGFPKPPSAKDLCAPTGVAVDASRNVYVADASNNRVLEYNTPLTTGTTADRVYGACGSFTSSACTGLSANSLSDPKGVAVDASGDLYVADFNNSRVLEYDQPPATPTPTVTTTATQTATATATATGTPTATATSTSTATATSTPTATATSTSTATATATPTPVPASLKVSPKALHFPAILVGSTSKPDKVKLSNPRNKKQDVQILIKGAVPTAPFAIDTALSTCRVGMQLAPKSDCYFFLTYTASALGTQTGTFTITDDSEAAGRVIVNLSGKGKAPKK